MDNKTTNAALHQIRRPTHNAVCKTTPKSRQCSAERPTPTSRWPDRQSLMNTFRIDRQAELTASPERCHFANAPTLAAANAIYGDGTAEEWLTYVLADISEFAGTRSKLTQNQILQTARLIAAEYGHLNMAELMLFSRRFKTGRYGRFYGGVDPMVILSGLDSFLRERAEAHALRDSREQERRISSQLHDPRNMSYAEWTVIRDIQAEYSMNTPEQDAATERDAAKNRQPHAPEV